MATREQLINYTSKNNVPIDALERALSAYNMKPLSYYEKQRLREGRSLEGNILTQAPENVSSNLKEIASGINTIGTIGVKLLSDPKFRDTTISGLKQYVTNRTVPGVAKDLFNTVARDYNITTDDMPNNPLDAVARVSAGIANRPITGLLDFAPLGKAIPKYTVGNTLEKVGTPKAIRQFIPSENVAKVNQAIKTGRGIVGTQANDLSYAFRNALDGVDKDTAVQAIRNLETGIWKGDEKVLKATNKLKSIQEKYNQELLSLGADANAERRVAIAQSIMEELNPDRANNSAYIDTINSAIAGDTNALNTLGKTKEQMVSLIANANKRYDEGYLRPLSHRYSFVKPEGAQVNYVASENLGKLSPRHYGWGTPEQLYDTLPQAYEDIAQSIAGAKSGKVSLNEIVTSVGRKVDKANPNLAKDEVLVSPRLFNDLSRSDFSLGSINSLPKRIDELYSGLAPSNFKMYDDVYAIKKEYLEPLKNSVNASSRNKLFGPFNSMWKYAQLTTPKYLTENRIGNTLLNTLEGVTPIDYIEGLMSKKIAPSRLRQETSYQGILGEEFAGSRTGEAIRRSLTDVKTGWKLHDPLKIANGINKSFANIVLPTEAGLEFYDRYANFIRQAKRMSKETGTSPWELIKQSNTDNDLYNKLIEPVQASLGDYTGRNWAINPGLYDTLSTMFPFFKYPTQAIRTFARQASEHPFRYQALVGIPQKIGSDIWDYQTNAMNLGEEELGGLFIKPQQSRFGPALLQRFGSHPLSAGAEYAYNFLGNPTGLNVSPLFDIARTFQFKDAYGNTASSPKYYNSGGYTFILDNNGNPTNQIMTKPTIGDVASQGLSTFANLYATPVVQWNRAVGPALAELTGNTFYPNYDTTIFGTFGDRRFTNPIWGGRINSRGRKGHEAFINPLMGITTRQVYPTQRYATPRMMKGVRRKMIRQKDLKNL